MMDPRIDEMKQLNTALVEIAEETHALAEKVKKLRNTALYLDYSKHRTLRDAYSFLELAQDAFLLSQVELGQ